MTPCRYLVAKYVGDDVRDEPINIGIIIQSENNRKTISKFITNYNKIRTGGEDVTILKEILEKIHHEISESKDKKILDKIALKYTGKIKFTEPRPTLVDDLEHEANSLFERYISIEQAVIEQIEKITLPLIKKQVWHYLAEDFRGYAKRNVVIKGKRSKFRYDFMLGRKDQILQAISYDAYDSLKKTKLVDWNVRDAIEANGLKYSNFGMIISRPTPDNPKYEKINQQYKEGIGILESRHYNLVFFDNQKKWSKEIRELV